jgi:hypothetical protein
VKVDWLDVPPNNDEFFWPNKEVFVSVGLPKDIGKDNKKRYKSRVKLFSGNFSVNANV